MIDYRNSSHLVCGNTPTGRMKMRTCAYCGAELPYQAGYCGNCGSVASSATGNAPGSPTSVSGFPANNIQANNIQEMTAGTTIGAPQWEYAPPQNPGQPSGISGTSVPQSYAMQPPPGYGAQAPSENEEEEERRRRAAILGLGLAGLAGEGQPPAGNVPMVQGTPSFGGVPSVRGTPQVPGNAAAPDAVPGSYSSGFYSSQTQHISHMAHTASPPHAPHVTPQPPLGGSGHPSPHHPPPGGCAPVWLIFLFAVILIISSIVSIGLTVLAPSLATLGGSTDVTLGGSLHLHGTSFIPGSPVILTLDDITPLFFTDQGSPLQSFHSANAVSGLGFTSVQLNLNSSSSNIVTAGGDGTFSVTITIGANWRTGQHTIRAAEKISPRSAVLTINVHQAGDTVTPSPSVTVSPSVTATSSPTASPTASPSTTPSGLSCANPSSVSLGPVSEGYNQALTSQIVLCASGTGTLNWTATWNQNQAPWLKLDNSTGQIQAPGQQQINVSALATNLKAGNYAAMVTFSSQQSSTTQTVNVSFTVQTGCIRASQQEFSFTGVAGISDPQAQTATISNCGMIGTWSTSVSTSNNVNWLSVSPTGGGLNGGATRDITIAASILKTKLGAGTYSGKIVFAIGSSQLIAYVTLNVQAGPQIVVVYPNPPSFVASKQCTLNQDLKYWTCIASISNSSQSLSLSWKSSSTGVANITFNPSSNTLAPGGGERVIITIPENNCQIPTTMSFIGPANTANISWSC
jgi:Viral BACON domain